MTDDEQTPGEGGRAPISLASDTRMSPDQSIRLDLLISEWSVSLWTHAPRITEVATGRLLLDLWGTSWDAETAWIGSNGLRLDFRRFDRGGVFTLLIDFTGKTYRTTEANSRPRALDDLRSGIDEAFEQAHLRYLDSLTPPAVKPDAAGTPARPAGPIDVGPIDSGPIDSGPIDSGPPRFVVIDDMLPETGHRPLGDKTRPNALSHLYRAIKAQFGAR
ncbi:hypothetical protein ACVWZA_002616 [Sphingomonas sp. UYAg733]